MTSMKPLPHYATQLENVHVESPTFNERCSLHNSTIYLLLMIHGIFKS